MNSRVKAVMWDVDGTLVDSEALHHQVLLYICAEHGLELEPGDSLELMGETPDFKWEFMQKRGGLGMGRKEWRTEFNRRYAASLHENLIRRETVAVVRVLHRAGIPQACVSNGDPEVVAANLALAGVAHCFSFRLCIGDFDQGKPSPQPYSLACAKLDLEPGHCMGVEDSPTGVRSVLGAGMICAYWPLPGHAGLPGLRPHFSVHQDGFPWHMFPGLEPTQN